ILRFSLHPHPSRSSRPNFLRSFLPLSLRQLRCMRMARIVAESGVAEVSTSARHNTALTSQLRSVGAASLRAGLHAGEGRSKRRWGGGVREEPQFRGKPGEVSSPSESIVNVCPASLLLALSLATRHSPLATFFNEVSHIATSFTSQLTQNKQNVPH